MTAKKRREEPSPATHADIVSLHRYFLVTARMRNHFHDSVSSVAKEADPLKAIILTDQYMDVYYGSLYVVIDGWEQLGLSDSAVDLLLSSPNKNLLFMFRNGVFHYQRDYWSQKRTALMGQGQDEVKWIENVYTALSRYFLRVLRQPPAAEPKPL